MTGSVRQSHRRMALKFLYLLSPYHVLSLFVASSETHSAWASVSLIEVQIGLACQRLGELQCNRVDARKVPREKSCHDALGNQGAAEMLSGFGSLL